jgi:hypothetical protein
MDNEPAFPNPGERAPDGTGIHAGSPGMTLRDWFAGQALQGMLAHSRNGHGYRPRDPNEEWHRAIADEAYELANMMLRARQR